MFTGIIQTIGKIVSIEGKETLRLVLDIPKIKPKPVLGSSVAINGVCLTVSNIKGSRYTFDIMKETVQKTIIAKLKTGDEVNVEGSLRVGDEVGGHFVFGHVDTIGKIQKIENKKNEWVITITADKKFMKYVALKGSVAINGVSLTVSKKGKGSFSVSLVPFTLENTTLHGLKKGDQVNLEADMLAKYIQTQLSSRGMK